MVQDGGNHPTVTQKSLVTIVASKGSARNRCPDAEKILGVTTPLYIVKHQKVIFPPNTLIREDVKVIYLRKNSRGDVEFSDLRFYIQTETTDKPKQEPESSPSKKDERTVIKLGQRDIVKNYSDGSVMQTPPNYNSISRTTTPLKFKTPHLNDPLLQPKHDDYIDIYQKEREERKKKGI